MFPFPAFDPAAPKVLTPIAQGTGTIIGNFTNDANAFDGNINQASGSCASINSTNNTAFIGKDWGASNEKFPGQMKAYPSNNVGFTQAAAGTFTLQLYGNNSAPANATDGTQLYDSGSFADFNGPSAHTALEASIDTSTAYRYWWVRCINPGAATDTITVAEIEFWELI